MSADLSSAFVGMQPQFRQMPPGRSRSMHATLKPSCAPRMAATYPPGPAPTTTRSYLSAMKSDTYYVVRDSPSTRAVIHPGPGDSTMVARSVSVRLVPGFASGCCLAIAAALALAAGCGGSSPATPTPHCVHDSECSGALVCVQGYCVGKCMTSKDCGGARCIKATEGPTCEPTESVSCHYNSECTKPLICSGDLQCRNQCQTSDDCAMGQVCTSVSKLCADPLLDKTYDMATNEFKGGTVAFGAGMVLADGGSGDTSATDGGGTAGTGGGAGSGDGSTSDGTGAGGADGGVADVPTGPEVGIATSCPGTPLTLFSKVALGDASKYYTSGVGVRVADEMVIFNGYTGPDATDGGVDAGDAGAAPMFVNRIDVQHFDLKGAAKGAATP